LLPQEITIGKIKLTLLLLLLRATLLLKSLSLSKRKPLPLRSKLAHHLSLLKRRILLAQAHTSQGFRTLVGKALLGRGKLPKHTGLLQGRLPLCKAKLRHSLSAL
jgi:hypothetical protein